ncbi:hypothetical protein OOK31_14045 [Streptomyces sp. NBC_00249]|uniref:hypothetical protein n=1 Tax=Streptomyces sp. NBC_00249 TaxID=2975690 RepID=UPI0022526337|nr:hypothetical protein [Streptomyces sp. NBC_00249]MCX5195012.1 hypothetical protein [Streptomyces sp. NBC_00249]
MTDKPSLRAYLKRYAQGGIPREEMIATVAAWDFEDEIRDELVIEPIRQDNTFEIVYTAVVLDQITRADLQDIERQMDAHG